LYDIPGDDMERIARQGLLYDFYGALLTEHQRHIYEDVVLYDLSLSEIAEQQGISRQGVHDLIKRCNKILEDYEEKLHLFSNYVVRNQLLESLMKDYASDDYLVRKLQEIQQIDEEEF